MSPDTDETRAHARKLLGAGEKDVVLAYFGRLYRGKGLETLLSAFHMLRSRLPNVKLAIIGGETPNWHGDSWRSEDLHQQVRALGIEDDVFWTGEYPWDSDLGSVYLRGVDVAVLPFDHGVDLNNSSFSTVAAHGLPTITTMRGDAVSAPFVDQENALFCRSQDPAGLANAMERLVTDDSLQERLRRGISTLSKEWFSGDAGVDRTISTFALGRRAPELHYAR